MSNTSNIRQLAAVIFASAALSGALQASVYNVVTDFHDPSNVNSVWSYGTSLTPGGALTPFPNYVVGYFNTFYAPQPAGDDGYYTNSSRPDVGPYPLPVVLKNTTSGPLDDVGTIHWPNNVLLLHPGAEGQYAVVRFTAPATATYTVQGLFTGLDNAGRTTTDVHVVPSSGGGFSQLVNDSGVDHPFSFTTNLAANQTIDFAVGYGANQQLYYDSTGLGATISATPEPGFYGLMALGLSGLGTVVVRRRNKAASSEQA